MLISPKWLCDIRHLAESIEISLEEANEFIKCIESGGKGSKADGTFQANPAPFNTKISLREQRDNILNLHYIDNGREKLPSTMRLVGLLLLLLNSQVDVCAWEGYAIRTEKYQ